ncbi:hypothetical protein ACHWQZ_G001355 [Mnemiopsis leidyi]
MERLGSDRFGGLCVSIGTGIISFLITWYLIPELSNLFLSANLAGKDLNKRLNDYRVPEGVGVIAGAIYLVCLFCIIPFYVLHSKDDVSSTMLTNLSLFLSALLSICCMILLGFTDDVLNLRWRHKLVLPTIASLPILMVYYVTYGNTYIVMPFPIPQLLNVNVFDLGFLYYVYMGMLAVFCTNAINILAGVNGVECGQSIVIALSVLLNSLINLGSECWSEHMFALYLVCPFIGVSCAVLYYNWYPSRVFVGDTFCYFAGMTFAVLGILGHFSKTMLMFFIPQIFNFVLSVPQLFHLVPCPRHRLPRLHPTEDVLVMSTVKFKRSDVGSLGRLCLFILPKMGLTKMTVDEEEQITITNLTILNVILRVMGNTHERTLTIYLLFLQVACSGVAFLIRYQLVHLFYDE